MGFSPHFHTNTSSLKSQVYLSITFLGSDLANLIFCNISIFNTIRVLVQIKEKFEKTEKAVQ